MQVLLPATGGGTNCTDLIEHEPCEGANNCDSGLGLIGQITQRYKYQVSQWTPCLPTTTDSPPRHLRRFANTIGITQRHVTCIDRDGAIVDNR